MSMSQSRLRQHRCELDERRRFLSGLEALAARLRRDVQRLHWEIEEETGAGGEQKTGVVYPIFVEPLVERRKKLERSIADIEAQIIEARETVATAEQELTLHEAAWANRSKGNAAAARRL